LESNLFNAGVRPAINVGISVSRVGGSAQIKSMKKVAGTLKTDQAQYRELESFSKFGGDMDPVTKMAIDKGLRNTQLLIQPQYSPAPVEEQIAAIYCGTKGLMNDVPVDKIHEFEKNFIELMRSTHNDVMEQLKNGVLNDEISQILEKEASVIANRFKNNSGVAGVANVENGVTSV
jgi:F-type H+-transporting ATPase subunit alpha